MDVMELLTSTLIQGLIYALLHHGQRRAGGQAG